MWLFRYGVSGITKHICINSNYHQVIATIANNVGSLKLSGWFNLRVWKIQCLKRPRTSHHLCDCQKKTNPTQSQLLQAVIGWVCCVKKINSICSQMSEIPLRKVVLSTFEHLSNFTNINNSWILILPLSVSISNTFEHLCLKTWLEFKLYKHLVSMLKP